MTSPTGSTGFRCPSCSARAGEPHTVECTAYEAWDVDMGFLPDRVDTDPVGELIGDPDD